MSRHSLLVVLILFCKLASADVLIYQASINECDSFLRQYTNKEKVRLVTVEEFMEEYILKDNNHAAFSEFMLESIYSCSMKSEGLLSSELQKTFINNDEYSERFTRALQVAHRVNLIDNKALSDKELGPYKVANLELLGVPRKMNNKYFKSSVELMKCLRSNLACNSEDQQREYHAYLSRLASNPVCFWSAPDCKEHSLRFMSQYQSNFPSFFYENLDIKVTIDALLLFLSDENHTLSKKRASQGMRLIRSAKISNSTIDILLNIENIKLNELAHIYWAAFPQMSQSERSAALNNVMSILGSSKELNVETLEHFGLSTFTLMELAISCDSTKIDEAFIGTYSYIQTSQGDLPYNGSKVFKMMMCS